MARDRILQIYRGTTAQNDAFTGAQGELTMDTSRKEIRIHDGSTAGGNVIGLTPGFIAQFAGSTAPAGWLICDGSAVSRTTYAKLFAVIGTTYGEGDGNTTFNIPNFAGAKIITQNNFDVIDGGNALVSLKWYDENGDAFSAGHALSAGSNASGTYIQEQNPTTVKISYTKLTTDFSTQPAVNIIIKF
jgi:microcystin-dependent protein